jgi:hypothetical protein
VILMDGAPYHQRRHDGILQGTPGASHVHWASLYDASPIELFFAAFKSKDVNPEKLSTGKK